jgi:quercetin 2,3-dioxygenase
MTSSPTPCPSFAKGGGIWAGLPALVTCTTPAELLANAGAGIRHSELNHSKEEPEHFLQIRVLPDRKGIAPRCDQSFANADKRDRLRLVGSSDGRDGSIFIHQDAEIHDALLSRDHTVSHDLKAGRKSWIQIVRGAVEVNGKAADAGDGVAVEDEAVVSIAARANDSHVLVLDLA